MRFFLHSHLWWGAAPPCQSWRRSAHGALPQPGPGSWGNWLWYITFILRSWRRGWRLSWIWLYSKNRRRNVLRRQRLSIISNRKGPRWKTLFKRTWILWPWILISFNFCTWVINITKPIWRHRQMAQRSEGRWGGQQVFIPRLFFYPDHWGLVTLIRYHSFTNSN